MNPNSKGADGQDEEKKRNSTGLPIVEYNRKY